MSAPSRIATDKIAQWWSQDPDFRSASQQGRIEAAIWSGEPREIWAEPDCETHVFAMPLTSYSAEPFADGRMIANTYWARGRFQTMVAGVTPRCVLRTNWRMLQVYVPRSLLNAVAEEWDLGQNIELLDPQGASDRELERIASGLETELTQGLQPSTLLIDSYGVQLAAALLRRWSNVSVAPRLAKDESSSPKNDRRLRRAMEIFNERLGEDIGLTDLATEVGLSASHFTVLFRSGTGLPPHRWLMKRRVERACEMLRDPRRSVTDIAHALGFASSQHLATVFKKQMGGTPTEYRRDRLS